MFLKKVVSNRSSNPQQMCISMMPLIQLELNYILTLYIIIE